MTTTYTLKDPRAAQAAAVVAESTAASRAAAVSRILLDANTAAGEGKPLEAMLGYLEWGLMTPEGGLPPDFQEHRDGIVQDANVRRLFGALEAKSADQAKSNMTTLTQLAPVAGGKSYVIGIFRANFESGLGGGDVAVSLLVEALARNPFITGVWKDLGDYLDTGYDAVDSWRCYEIARLIAPNHRLLSQVARREAAMKSEHPEFF